MAYLYEKENNHWVNWNGRSGPIYLFYETEEMIIIERNWEITMQQTLHIQCPTELLKSLQVNAEAFAEIIKWQTAIALFKQGKISSGMAAKWLNIPRATFLMQAMEAGAELLENTPEDFERETALL